MARSPWAFVGFCPQRCPSCVKRLLLLAVVCRAGAGDEQPLPATYFCDPVSSEVVMDPPEEWKLCAPQLIVAGAEKCGTTSIFEYLRAHPDFMAPNKTFLLERPERARLIRAMRVLRRGAAGGKGRALPSALEQMFNEERMLKQAGNLRKDEIDSAKPVSDTVLSLRPQELESFFSPVRVEKEVRYYLTSFHTIVQELGFTKKQGYAMYLNVFPRVPVPPSQMALVQNETDRMYQDKDLPAHLASNLGKVIGEASPQYLDTARFAARRILRDAPRTRLLILMREPVGRFNSQAVMIHHMAGTHMDPTMEHFEDSVLRCFADKEGQPHPSVRTNRIKSGGGTARMNEISWENTPSKGDVGGTKWDRLREELLECFSHGLGQFVFKGVYVVKIHQWLSGGYPREQIMALPSEQLYSRTVETMHRVANFAGLRPIQDEVWAKAARFRYSPLFHPSNITFTMKVEEVSESRAKSSKESVGFSDQAKQVIREFYAGPNCGLRYLLDVDWSNFGWHYCAKASKLKENKPPSTEL